MPDRLKAIKGLYQHCEGSMFDRCGECPYYEVADEPFRCRDALLMDALALLREQEPVRFKVTRQRLSYPFWDVECDGCGYQTCTIHEGWKYCPECGRKVKWDD